MKNINPVQVGKMALIILIVIIAVLIAWKAFKFFRGQKTEPKSDETIPKPNPKLLTLSLSQIIVMADTLQQAMDSSNDDEDLIYSVFERLGNIEDLKQLIITYGKRKYVQPIGFWRETDNLIQTLHAKLDSGEIDNINKILKNKGINFKV